MASEYDALLTATGPSEYDALLSAAPDKKRSSEYDALIQAAPPPLEIPQEILDKARPEQGYNPAEHPVAEKAAGAVVNALNLPTSFDEVKHELDLLGLTQDSPVPLPRFVDQPRGTMVDQALQGALNLPADTWNFLTSPSGAAIAATGAAAPSIVQRAIALGFTGDMIRQGLQAGNLGDQVELALGAGLGVHGATRGEIKPASEPIRSTANLEPIAPDAPATESSGQITPGGETLNTQRSGGLPTTGQPEIAAGAPVEQTPGGMQVPPDSTPLVDPAAVAAANEAAGVGPQSAPAATAATAGALRYQPIIDAETGQHLILDRENGNPIRTQSNKPRVFRTPEEAVNIANDLNHESSIDQAQAETAPVFGFGPGAASVEEALSLGSQIKQLTETVSDALRTERPTPASSRVQRAINAAGGTLVTAREILQRGANTVRGAWLGLKNAYLRPAVMGDFWGSVKDWQGADQRTSFEVRKFVQELRSQIKDPLIREAITNYIQADGDPAVLGQRAAASNIKYRPGYEAAMTLTDAQKTLAANVRQYFDGMLQDGMNAGILEHGLENYINQVWKRPNKFTQALTADLQAGKLQTNFQFARKRIFESFFEGEQANYAPASKDVSSLLAAYDLSFNKALSARAFVKGLREAKVNGEPAVKFSGAVQPIQQGGGAPEAYMIRSRSIPEKAVTADGRAYVIVDHPALRGWKFVVQDGAAVPAYYQADMMVHPDHAGNLKNILGRSWFRQNPVTATLLKAGAIAKQTKLSLSIFHLDQEGLHGLFHRVNPANLAKINFDDPVQWKLVRNGLQVADYQAMELFSEGLRGGGLVAKIPVLGELQNRFNEFLFKDYIPRLKMTMALHAFERNVKRYPQLSPDVIAELTGRQANAAFGELNYKLMGRNPTLQDFLRLTVLAPDFLEARSRFVGQALKPYGREQQAALMLGAATMYVAARAMNKWLDDDPHWNKPFSVVYNGREYRLRTVMGDAAEVFMDPRRFFYNRFSPWLKQGVTLATGRDYRGIKLTAWEQVKDALSWLVPIPAGEFEGRGLPGDVRAAAGGRLQPIVNRALGTAGVSNKPAEGPADQVYKAALKFKEGLTDPKIQAEVKRAQQETYAGTDYARVNRALIEGDNERAVSELVAVMRDKGKTPADIVKFYSSLPMRPFTGSRALEAQFLAGMSAPERSRYQSAVNQRLNLARSVFPLLPMAIREIGSN